MIHNQAPFPSSPHDGLRPDPVQEASEESFPASDPPSFTPVSRLGAPAHPRPPGDRPVREAIALFASIADLEDAIDDLESHGFDHAEISLLAGGDRVARTIGRDDYRTGELADDPAVPTAPYVQAESIVEGEGALIGAGAYIGALAVLGVAAAAGATLPTAIATALVGAGAGGAIGGILAGVLGHRHAEYLRQQIARGGVPLWVRTWTAEDERKALAILRRHGGREAHVHDVARAPAASANPPGRGAPPAPMPTPSATPSAPP